MLNLARVLCLLLVAKATIGNSLKAQSLKATAGHFASIESAQKSCSDAITWALQKIETHYARNVECVRAEILRIELEKRHLHPELKSHSKQKKFSRRVNKVTMAIGNYTELISRKINTLGEIYETECDILRHKQLLADACVPSHSNNMMGRRRAVVCINKVRDSVLDKTQRVKLYFSKICKDAKKLAKSGIGKLKVLISSMTR